MAQQAQDLYQLIRHIRSCFHQLKALGDELHGGLDITVSMRAVMESLEEDGEQTVPQIAGLKAVSRQHIQVNVDALAKARLVTFRDNPGHKRSPVIVLTPKGRTTFAGMRRRESDVLKRLAKAFRADELHKASDTLTKLKHSIVAERTKGGTDD
jgi:DNA-binding MarR family transcriptional regulator